MVNKVDIASIRKDFPILQRKVHGKSLVYLDNAATTQKPRQVIDSLNEFYEKHNANIHRGVHQLSEESTELYDKAHVKVGRFINAHAPMQEIIFVRNTTEAINLVMYGWALSNLEKGDEILATKMEHHSNIVPWQFLRKRGVIVRFVDVDEEGKLNMEDAREKINNKTRLLACVHISNLTGTINPVKELTELAHEHGALILVDGAQSVPHMTMDVQQLDIDFLAFSGHKMLAPTGIGVLYGKKMLLEKMEPFLYGGDMIREVTLDTATWNELPWKFEAGTPNIAGGIGLAAAVDYLSEIGMENIWKHEQELVQYGLKELKKFNVTIHGPKSADRGGLITFNIPGVHPHDVASILDTEYGVAIRSGHHCAQPLTEHLVEHATCRASFYLYNTKEEIDVLVEGIKKVKEVFRK